MEKNIGKSVPRVASLLLLFDIPIDLRVILISIFFLFFLCIEKHNVAKNDISLKTR